LSSGQARNRRQHIERYAADTAGKHCDVACLAVVYSR
jgi:hypothetical protein